MKVTADEACAICGNAVSFDDAEIFEIVEDLESVPVHPACGELSPEEALKRFQWRFVGIIKMDDDQERVHAALRQRFADSRILYRLESGEVRTLLDLIGAFVSNDGERLDAMHISAMRGERCEDDSFITIGEYYWVDGVTPLVRVA